MAIAIALPSVTTPVDAQTLENFPSSNIHVGAVAGGEFQLSQTDKDSSHSHHPATSGRGHSRPSVHAPIGVMGDHMHAKGEIMLSYRFMQMHMAGNRDGGSRRSTSEVLNDFVISPTEMDMKMHMLGMMYAPTDNVTLMVMGSIVETEMDHQHRNGTLFTTKANGFGDTRATALIKLWEQGRQSLHFNAGLSFPTGSIDETDATPMGANTKLPYPMQLGSGTYDLLPGVTYNGESGDMYWGAQTTGTIRLGENSEDYTLGNQAAVTVWNGFRFTDELMASLRLNYSHWENIDGVDPELPAPGAMIVPTADPDRRGGDRLDMLFGINLVAAKGIVKAHRLAFEIGFPVVQDLDGPQLETDWILTVGWQYSR